VKTRRYRKFFLALLIPLLAVSACTSSGGSSSNPATSDVGGGGNANPASQGVALILTDQPVPVFATSAYRTELITVEATEALGSPTTAMFFPPGWNGNSHPFRTCAAAGLPIPNTAELSNPDEIVQDPNGGGTNLNPGSLIVAQMDPNGVYTPASSSGTYVTCVVSGGNIQPAYWEGDVYAQAGTAVWDSSANEIESVGASGAPQCTVVAALPGNSLKLKAGTRYYDCVNPPGYTPPKSLGVGTSAWEPKYTPHGIVLTAWDKPEQMTITCSPWNKDKGIIAQICTYPNGFQLIYAGGRFIGSSKK
jgi:hypothetical protein